MERKHTYNTSITWTGNRGSGTLDYRAYDRNYTIKIEGKSNIDGSSDSVFSGDPKLHNPEDLLLSSVSACHMLWYLHLCADNNIVVLEYSDEATGVMEEIKDGSGKFTEITLHPKVVINDEKNRQLAIDLHKKANEMCFIANSLNFNVNHEIEILTSK